MLTSMPTRKSTSGNPWPGRLLKLRKKHGLTQAQAAEKIAAALGTWRNWEQGLRIPSPMVLKLIDLAFGENFSK